MKMYRRSSADRRRRIALSAALVLFPALTVFTEAPAPSRAHESPVEIRKERGYARAGRHLNYFFERHGRLSIETLLSQRPGLAFLRNDSQYASFGFVEEAVWLEFRMRGQAGVGPHYFVELQNPMLREVEFYLVKDGKVAERHIAGLFTRPENRAVDHRYHVFPVSLAVGEAATVYLRVASTESLQIPVFIWSAAGFYRADTNRNFGYGLFFGLVLVMAVYNFFIFLSVKDRSYLYYVLYISLLGALFALLHGYGYLFFYNFLARVQAWIAPFCALSSSLAALAFTRRFLLLKESAPRGYKLITLLMALHALVLIALPFLPPLFPARVGNAVPVLGIAAIVPLAIFRARQNFRPARYFLAAWSFIIIGAVTFIAQNFGLVPSNFFTNNAMMFGGAVEALLLSFALGYRINELTRIGEEAREATLIEQKRAFAHQERMAEAFSRFVPRQFLNHLDKKSVLEIEHGDAVERRMCVLFTDIRDFTALSEKLGSRAVFQVLNEYLARMAPIIEQHGGFIDKFIGDAIMALFPGAEAGTRAAVEMARAVDQLAALPHMPSGMRTGYGLHFGELMLGTLGSPQRLETTVIGDTVNLAARIESVTKQYGSRIIVSDTVFRALSNDEELPAREIDTVFVKGKERPVVLFEVYGADPEEDRRAKQAHNSDFLAALAYFRSGRFADSKKLFEAYARICPIDPLPAIYLERIQKLEARGEQGMAEWTGIYETW